MNAPVQIPLEDELGDVLDKAMVSAGLTTEELSAASGVSMSRIRDAIDYRPDLAAGEVSRLAAALRLNEVGLCALAAGRYPLPEPGAMPFCVRPLRMVHGIGVVNAYVVHECGSDTGLLFDTGPGLEALQAAWPVSIRRIEGVFLTHVETEHAGGLCAVVERFKAGAAFVPNEAEAPCGQPMGEGQRIAIGSLEVEALNTPGHVRAHNCYCVRSRSVRSSRALLVSGDLVFAGSAGGAYFCAGRLRDQLARVLRALPRDTLVAPGHGPMTTVGNELEFNPFVV